MGGKSKSVTVGYWYRVLFHHILGIGPIDALLEIRGGDKTAWQGELTQSATINVNKPGLWGGEKDQGGIVGDIDVMFGESTQQPNAYMLANLGNQVPAWRGIASVVFKGGRFGAMNPYPQKPAYKIRRILKGWDNDPNNDGSGCWYPEKAQVPVNGTSQESATITNFGSGFTTNAPTKFQLIDGAIANTLVNADNADYWRMPIPVAGAANLYCEFVVTQAGGGDPLTIAIAAASGAHIVDFCPVCENRVNAAQPPCINYFGTVKPILPGALAIGVPYSFEVAMNRTAGKQTYWLRQGATVLATGTADMANATPAFLVFGRTGNADPSAISKFTRVRVTGGGTAMNPAHILYDARTAQDMGGEPVAVINDASYRAAADWFYANGVGLCTEYDSASESVEDFRARIERVAGCSENANPVNGQWYLDIANGVFDLASLPVLTDDDILSFNESPRTVDNAINSIAIEYFDPVLNTTVTTSPTQALALVTANGLNHNVNQYHEVPTSDLADRLALRDLAADITPTRAFSLTTTRKPYAWRKNTYFRLQSPKRGIADMVCVLAERSGGTLKSGAMTLTATQDIYSLPAASFTQSEPGVDTRPPQLALPITSQQAFEAPYIEVVRALSRADLDALPADVGYLMAVAADPATSRDYTLIVSSDGGTTYDGNATGQFCPSASVVEGDTLQDGAPATAFTLAGGKLLSRVQVGSAALWDAEIVRVDAIDPVAGTLTIGRGCADTPPTLHAPGSTIWFYDGNAAEDGVEYTDGETLDVKLLTNTASQQVSPGQATPMALTFGGRQSRPYAPAGLTINGVAYPAVVQGSIDLAWVERNRVVQADQLVDTGMATIAPDAGTTYTVRTYLNDALVQTQPDLATTSATATPGGYGTVRIEVDAVIGGVASWRPLAATFDFRSNLAITTASPIKLTVGAVQTVQLEADGGVPPFTWSVDPATPLPDGVTLTSGGELDTDGTQALGDTDCNFIVTDSIESSAGAPLTISVLDISFLSYVDDLVPVAHWRMGDAPGSTKLVDRIAGEQATLAGGYTLGAPGLVTGDTDKAVLFAGGWATGTASQKWSLGTGDFSALCAAQWTGTTLSIVADIRDSSSSNIMFLFTTNRTKVGQVGIDGWNWATTGKQLLVDGTYNDGMTHVLGLTYEKATDTMRFYVDGVLKVTTVQTGGNYARPTSATMMPNIATNLPGSGQQFKGTLDEYTLFDKRLTDQEMADIASLILTGHT